MTDQQPEMLWIDLETTGLNAQSQVPLELGLAVTDSWGNILRENSWMIMEGTTRYQKAIDDAYDHEIVGPMHQKSGLWIDLEKGTTWSRRQVDRHCTNWLSNNIGIEKGTLPMAGSSIGSLDRPFVIQHFPLLNEFFHYRNIDVSTIGQVAKLHNKPVYDARPQEDGAHRVLDDIKASIKLYRFYIEEFLLWET